MNWQIRPTFGFMTAYFRNGMLQDASSQRYRDMRLSHPIIFSGLPRDATLLTGESGSQFSSTEAAQYAEHLSQNLLWDIVKTGRSLPEFYIQHANDCRDCRDFVREFSEEARSSGFPFSDLLRPIQG